MQRRMSSEIRKFVYVAGRQVYVVFLKLIDVVLGV
jgi:hypothetical protein